MIFLKFVLSYSKALGIFCLLTGFFLIPFAIGIPVFIAGIILLVFSFHKDLIFFLFPKAIRKQIGNEIIKSYQPYQPALKSMKSIGLDMIKMSLIVSVIITIVVAIFIFGFKSEGNYWKCNEKGVWVKEGYPDYPRPGKTCGSNSLPKNKSDCLSQGGIWKKLGLSPFESCNRKATDRGNLCRDNDECEGICQTELSKEEMSQGMSGEIKVSNKYGQCSVWVVELGCRGIMTKGNTQVICID